MQRLTRVHTGLIVLVISALLMTGCGGNATPDPEAVSAAVHATLTASTLLAPQVVEVTSSDSPDELVAQEITVPDTEKDGMQMIYVPAGQFIMGSSGSEGWEDERPQHTVYLDAFLIDKTEVTVAQFDRCVRAGTCTYPGVIDYACTYDTIGKLDHPINCVDWNQARTYCNWVGRRLPTEAEWEKAARGTDGRTYPWGNSMPNPSLASFDMNVDGTTSVGRYPRGASPYGVLDMAGNVWEWVADWHDGQYYAQSPSKNPLGPSSGTFRVVRGGSWDDAAEDIRVAYRSGYEPGIMTGRHDDLGFRCARSAPQESTPTSVPTIPPPPVPTSTPTAEEIIDPPKATANQSANLRAGPGTSYARVGGVAKGDILELFATNAAGDWYQLIGGAWIAAFLVDGAPTGLPVISD